jgi:hypothetical protein
MARYPLLPADNHSGGGACLMQLGGVRGWRLSSVEGVGGGRTELGRKSHGTSISCCPAKLSCIIPCRCMSGRYYRVLPVPHSDFTLRRGGHYYCPHSHSKRVLVESHTSSGLPRTTLSPHSSHISITRLEECLIPVPLLMLPSLPGSVLQRPIRSHIRHAYTISTRLR